MLKKTTINDMANIIAGYTFRSAIKPAIAGNIFVVQAKDINKNEYINNLENLTRTSLEIPRSKSYLRYDDVLLTSRGTGLGNFKSTVFKFKAGNVIASSSVYIIRIRVENVLPEYLSLYFNYFAGQKALYKIVSGGQIQTINRKDLVEIKIPIPELNKQKSLTALYENINRQEKILARTARIKQSIINTLMRDIATN